MTPIEPHLEDQLSGLTRWTGAKTSLWRSALKQSRDPDGRGPARSLSPWNRRLQLTGLAAAVLTIAGAIVFLNTDLPTGHDRSDHMTATPAKRPPLGENRAAPGPGGGSTPSDPVGIADQSARMGWASAGGVGGGGAGSWPSTNWPDVPGRAVLRGGQGDAPLSSEPSTERFVVRKATMEIDTDDVRAAFVKVQLLISEADDEYVEASKLTGDGEDGWGQLTLRVRADRLSDVLNDLRELGDVRNESMGGADVTGNVVDLDARLRNEQRVERELLELLESREDAPLDEILDLRQQVNQVRGQIEQLQGRRNQLSRLVSLATVLVIIRPIDAPASGASDDANEDATIGAYLSDAAGDAWSGGLRTLVDTLTGLLRVLVGGLIWWVALLMIVGIGLHHWRRARALAGY